MPPKRAAKDLSTSTYRIHLKTPTDLSTNRLGVHKALVSAADGAPVFFMELNAARGVATFRSAEVVRALTDKGSFTVGSHIIKIEALTYTIAEVSLRRDAWRPSLPSQSTWQRQQRRSRHRSARDPSHGWGWPGRTALHG
tara:strand:+ start:149 stop:568 length:420 start_codon:yes stop_codon:yes gene_type:complete